jgi:hypothetical protein
MSPGRSATANGKLVIQDGVDQMKDRGAQELVTAANDEYVVMATIGL